MTRLPLVVHLLYRLDFGGLETLLAECVNRMPAGKYRHAIVCLTDYTDFSKKITRPEVEIIALHKPPGLAPQTHWKVWKLLRRLQPAILHTYNLAALEYGFTAALAGVPVRIHAEHGRDAGDPEGKNPKHNALRRFLVPFIDRYIPVSADLQRWLDQVVRIPAAKNQLINNGVDTDKFKPALQRWASNVFPPDCFVIGTVGRVQDVKNHAGLVDAFVKLQQMMPEAKQKLRLAIIGDGPLMSRVKAQVAAAGIEDQVWLPGARTDIAELMRGFSVFVLPSIAEGTPVTLLEAMATGLPVVASRVGGIPEVVTDGVNGTLVPAADTNALAAALATYLTKPQLAQQAGMQARERVERQYSMTAMIQAYTALYDTLRDTKTAFREPVQSCAE